jgi:gliding motility-associated-like protein
MSYCRKGLLCLLLLIGIACQAQLAVAPQTSPETLAQKLLGSGVIISNVRLHASPLSTGFFVNRGGTALGLDSGLVLSTGRVKTEGNHFGLDGPATGFASSNLDLPGDAALSGLIGQGVTSDAAILEFDFVPLGDSIRFRYVFSSEEYPAYACSPYNDVFAFFLSGPGYPAAVNLALVPQTTIPVSINSINSGSPGQGYALSTCSDMGNGAPFTQYYLDNAGGNGLTHNGHTTVLTAVAAVQPCQSYHLRIAIADAGGTLAVPDRTYDSNVFIEAHSLQSSPVHLSSGLPSSGGRAYLTEGCERNFLRIQREQATPAPQTLYLRYGGAAINGIDLEQLPSTVTIGANDSVALLPLRALADQLEEGEEELKIFVTSGCGAGVFAFDSLILTIRDYEPLTLSPSDTAICAGATVQLQAPSGFQHYQWEGATPMPGNAPALMVSPVLQTEYRCIASRGTCRAKGMARVAVRRLLLAEKRDVYCINGQSGLIRVSASPGWGGVEYSLNGGAFGPQPLFTSLAAGSYTIRARGGGCMDSISVTLVRTTAFTDPVISEQVVAASCTGANGRILAAANGGLLPYEFSIDGNDFATLANFTVSAGVHTLSVRDANGCQDQKLITIPMDPPITAAFRLQPAGCEGLPDGRLFITAAGGSGAYRYTLGSGPLQSADSFAVQAGTSQVRIVDDKGCSFTDTVRIPSLPLPLFIGNDTAICEGSTVRFSPVTTATAFSWQPHSSLSATHLANPTATPADTTDYILQASRNGCTATDTIRVNVWKAPVADAGRDTTLCAGREYQLQGRGGVGYSWQPAPALDRPQSPSPRLKTGISTRFTLQVRDARGCRSLQQDTVMVHFIPAVRAFAGKDTQVVAGQPLQLTATDLSGKATRASWWPVTGLSDPQAFNPVATVREDVHYVLTLATPEGCTGKDTLFIRAFLGPQVYVPTAFTPDGNGRNDLLRPLLVGMKGFHYFRVYNRWGQVVYATATAGAGWNGTVQGVRQDSGTFLWVVSATDERGQPVLRKGTVVLVR